MALSTYARCPRRPVAMGKRIRSRLYREQLDLATPRQWQDLVPRDLLREVADRHGGDQADGKLTAPVHFWVLLVGVLSKACSSLKDLIARTQARFGQRLGWLPDDDKPWVTPSALSQRNHDRPVAFWQALYQRLRQPDFALWWRIDLARGYFITPLKANLVYQHLRWLNAGRRRERVRDRLVRFPGMDRGEDFLILRLVEVRQADGSWWSYVTNLIDEGLTAEDVADLYRLRWRVEIFFRHLKHTLNLGHWFAESEQGVQAHLYVALIGYVLSQLVLLWASREAGLALEQFRCTAVVHELAAWLLVQLYLGRLLPLQELLDRARRNAVDKDRRRNSTCVMESPG